MNNAPLYVTWLRADRPSITHIAADGVSPADVRVGHFPLRCGRWAPDGFDADILAHRRNRVCRRCLARVG